MHFKVSVVASLLTNLTLAFIIEGYQKQAVCELTCGLSMPVALNPFNLQAYYCRYQNTGHPEHAVV